MCYGVDLGWFNCFIVCICSNIVEDQFVGIFVCIVLCQFDDIFDDFVIVKFYVFDDLFVFDVEVGNYVFCKYVRVFLMLNFFLQIVCLVIVLVVLVVCVVWRFFSDEMLLDVCQLMLGQVLIRQ